VFSVLFVPYTIIPPTGHRFGALSPPHFLTIWYDVIETFSDRETAAQ
jgi:hypothetical protein